MKSIKIINKTNQHRHNPHIKSTKKKKKTLSQIPFDQEYKLQITKTHKEIKKKKKKRTSKFLFNFFITPI